MKKYIIKIKLRNGLEKFVSFKGISSRPRLVKTQGRATKVDDFAVACALIEFIFEKHLDSTKIKSKEIVSVFEKNIECLKKIMNEYEKVYKKYLNTIDESDKNYDPNSFLQSVFLSGILNGLQYAVHSIEQQDQEPKK